MHFGDFLPFIIIGVVIVLPLFAMWSGVEKERLKARQSSLTDEDRANIERLKDKADDLVERIAALEAILDVEVPDWREEHDYNDR